MGRIIRDLLEAYVVVIFAQVILSWFPVDYNSPLAKVNRVLYTLTRPVLGPLRRIMPTARAGSMAFDFSPVIAIIVLSFIASQIPT